MLRKFTINSKSTGKYEKKIVNSRECIVTSMVSIVGDSVMNRLGYPFAQVVNSYKQLDNLHAPAGHPSVGGTNVSAFLPSAVNAFGVGGSVSNPRLDGRRVINDLVFDIEAANKDERGKEIIQRIENGEKIGVSTGLNADVSEESGMMDGEQYTGLVSNIQFDHVAVLLTETPAGKETFTVNSDELMICNVAESVRELEDKVWSAVKEKFGENAYPSEILLNPDQIVVRIDEALLLVSFGYNEAQNIVFTGEPVPVEKKVTFEKISNNEADDMDQLKFILALIANATNSLTAVDQDKLMAMSETGLASFLSNLAELTIEQATAYVTNAGFFVNSISPEDYQAYLDNQAGYEAYQLQLANERESMTNALVEKSKMSKEQLDALPIETLKSIANEIAPDQNYGLQGAQVTNATPGSSTLKLCEGS